jgi:hypothetical protein
MSRKIHRGQLMCIGIKLNARRERHLDFYAYRQVKEEGAPTGLHEGISRKGKAGQEG